MKRLIFLLVLCLIGFAGMSVGIEVEKQLKPPELNCVDLDIGMWLREPQPPVPVFVVNTILTQIAIVPEMAVSFVIGSAYVVPEAVIKPPGTLTSFQATNKNLINNARDWLIHRDHLSKTISFMLWNYLDSPNAFD